MAYVRNYWSEDFDESAKLVALNNLETIYQSGSDYLDAMTHSDRYDAKAVCDGKYFRSDNDGEGSGLICETIDGYSAQDIIDAGTPSGGIAIWSGSSEAIPSGWRLCDGEQGTPDLRDKFIAGAGGELAAGDTGGSNYVTATGTVTILNHALTIDEMPAHDHEYADYQPMTSGGTSLAAGSYAYAGSLTSRSATTGTRGGGGEHLHTASFSGDINQDKRPPYYALCYIMKL